MATDLPTSKSLRAGLRAAGKPDRWDNEKRPTQPGYDPRQVQMHAVMNSEWQKVRLSMKGQDTFQKIRTLETFWDRQMHEAHKIESAEWSGTNSHQANEARANALKWATEVQVGNYLGALRRGGQLDNENKIRKAR